MTDFSIHPATLDFNLPEELIAQEPLVKRDHAKLLVLDRASKKIQDKHFYDLRSFLKKGDVLVINTAQVDRAKLLGKKKTGGKVEVILIGPEKGNRWRALVRPELKVGTQFMLGEAEAELAGRTENGENIIAFLNSDPVLLRDSAGRLPLPPYIRREAEDSRHEQDARDYQTVYAKNPGSLAAPTAGLHFTDSLLSDLEKAGVEIVRVLLNVGWGTFKPISKSIDEHQMMAERYELTPASADTIYAARASGRRIVAVGTTATRVLESLPDDRSALALKGETSLFIRPGFSFRWVGALVTNLHVPRSTPVSLTSAFAGLEFLEKTYEHAIEEKYRFFSYGDAMFIQ